MYSWLSGWAGTVLSEAGAGTGSPMCVSPAGSQTWMQPPGPRSLAPAEARREWAVGGRVTLLSTSGVWGTEILTWSCLTCPKVPYRPAFLDLSLSGAPPTPSQKSGPWPSSGGTLAGPSPPGAWPAGGTAGGRSSPEWPQWETWAPSPAFGLGRWEPPRTTYQEALEFLASVMWTQLSFSTTLMCFTLVA